MKLKPRFLSIIAASALSLVALTAAPANAAITQISGTESCQAGYVFEVFAHGFSGTATLYINNKKVSSHNFAVNHRTNLRSGTWKVTAKDFGTANSRCVATGWNGGGGGGSFSVTPTPQ